MTQLIKLTTEYSSSEDRLCITGQDYSEKVYRIWLTRRLADVLFKNLIDGLADHTAISPNPDLMQSFQQEQAAQARTPQERVTSTPGADTSAWLVDNIDVSRGDNGVQLAFKSSEGDQAAVVLGMTELRQWLSICAGVYRAADWPMAVWPVWIAAEGSAEAVGQHIIVH